MAKTGVIQLYGVDGNDVALFTFDPEQHKEYEAVIIVENAIEIAFQKDERGELEGNDVLNEAQEQLEKVGIDRIFAAIAKTNRL